MNITKTEFGISPQKESIFLYRIENESGASVTLCNYGCRLTSIVVPDKTGSLTDICLGLSDCEQYFSDQSGMGIIAGRYANRIAGGEFTLNNTIYQLALNNGENHLHGGPTGFGQRVWNGKISGDKVIFSRTSSDGEEGYPGNLNISVTYGWSEDNELSISYEAVSDADTILSVTSHGYFNLDGEGSDTVLDHELRIDANCMTPVNSTQIPTGEVVPVDGTPFDFREFKPIGRDIHANDPQLAIAGTYDHNFVLNGTCFREAAVLQSKASGIRMTCFTDQPGLQLYVPCHAIPQTGKDNHVYAPFSSVCLETQHFPDSVHHADFPSVVLKAGDTFKSKTIYHFSVM